MFQNKTYSKMFWGNKNVQKLIVAMVAKLCEYAANQIF